MKLRDLEKQYLELQSDIDEAIKGVLQEANFISGRQVTELEEILADYVGVKYCISCANGTDALTLALMAWGIGAGDAVFVPDFTFFATAEVVAFAGATPIFVDVDGKTFNLDCTKLEAAIQKVIKEGKLKPKVIIPVDLFGQPADYLQIREIANKYGLRVLEDGAQGFGGSIDGKMACSFGDISTTSFFPAKPLGCYGDGGAIFTNDQEMAEMLKSYRVHGKGTYKYDNVRIGVNSRLDTVQAAILQVKFKAFAEYELQAVNRVAKYYSEGLKEYVTVPEVLSGYGSSWAQYVIKTKDVQERDSLQGFLKERGIPTMIYYPKPLHEQVAFNLAESDREMLVVSSELSKRVLALPMHPYLSETEQQEVIGNIKRFYK